MVSTSSESCAPSFGKCSDFDDRSPNSGLAAATEPRVAKETGSTPLREYALEAGRAELDDFLSALEPQQRMKISTTVDVGRARDSILKRGGSRSVQHVMLWQLPIRTLRAA